MTREDQIEFIKAQLLCFACLKPHHLAKNCRRKAECCKCNSTHPTIFHDHVVLDEQGCKTAANGNANHTDSSTKDVNTKNAHSNNANRSKITSKHQVMSWVIPVYISHKSNPQHEHLIYALMDSGSDYSYITEKTVDSLGINATSTTKLNMSTLTDTNTLVDARIVNDLRVRGYKSKKHINMPTIHSQVSIPTNRNHIPTASSVEAWPHLAHLSKELLSESLGKHMEVGLLLGYDVPQAHISRDVISRGDDEPFATRTDLGWCFMGNSPKPGRNPFCHRVICEPVKGRLNRVTFQCCPEDQLSRQILQTLESDFQISPQEKDQCSAISVNDRRFIQILNDGICKSEDGYITMPLPLKANPPANNSKAMASQRFDLLEKKLKDPTYSAHYHEFMTQIINHGDAEVVPTGELEKVESWYIPHFGVYHPKKPHKIRVVFDCCAKTQGHCLNDYLLQGPDQINSLLGILLRFRKEEIAITCDVERMFHQFRVSERHRDLLRFFWYDSNGNRVTYRMKVHLFGASSSPGCATYGFRALCNDNYSHGDYEPAKRFILESFYVDDGLVSVETVHEAKKLIHHAVNICKKGNLRLHKFASNSGEVLDSLPPSERAIQDSRALDLETGTSPLERTLGIIWAVKQDSFKFTAILKEKPNTWRGILSYIASIYDPLGLISFILQGKQILREMCKTSTGWDEPISESCCQDGMLGKKNYRTLKVFQYLNATSQNPLVKWQTLKYITSVMQARTVMVK